jgi:sec-independent protein translocase protein TatA
MFGLSMQELVIVGVVAVLLFGKRLPEVARSIGHTYREFKRGLVDLQSNVDVREMRESLYTPPTKKAPARRFHDDIDDREESTAPKFEPPPSEPTQVG